MKLTEEHKQAIDKTFPKTQCSSAVRGAAEWAIEKFGGIQWNKYPETKPKIGEYVDIITKHKRRVADCEAEADGFYNRDSGDWFDHEYVTHWAYINLPNQ